MRLNFKQFFALELYKTYRKITTNLHELQYLFWECTLKCNLQCLHCGSDCTRNSINKDMPLADFLTVIDKIKNKLDPNKIMIVLTGGEPLIRADLAVCGMELYKRGFPWGLVTNGYLLSEDKIQELLCAGLHSITVSLDGLAETHDWFRGKAGSFNKAYNAIKTLARNNEIVFDIVTCINKRNLKELSELKEQLIMAGVKRWRIFTIFPKGRARNNALLELDKSEMKELMDFIIYTRQEKRIKVSIDCEGFLGNYEGKVSDNFFFCRAGINVGSILVDGSISACPSLRADYIQGNIYQDDFLEVWENRYHNMRDRSWTKNGICSKCKYFKYCAGSGLHGREESDKEHVICHLETLK